MKRGLVGKPPAQSRMSAARWNREQQAAIDKSESIMQRALKEPGLLAQYEMMRARYDADDNRVFRMVFGQYLSWFQTWIGDYDGARASFSLPQPAQPDDAPPPRRISRARGRRGDPRSRARTQSGVLQRIAQRAGDAHADGRIARAFARTGLRLFRRGNVVARFRHRTHIRPRRSGFYVNEPICGEMLRAALRLGYHVIAYDAEEGCGRCARTGRPRNRSTIRHSSAIRMRDSSSTPAFRTSRNRAITSAAKAWRRFSRRFPASNRCPSSRR